MFSLSETFHGNHPPPEPETGKFAGFVVYENADDKITSGSFPGEMVVFYCSSTGTSVRESSENTLFSQAGKTCRFYSLTRDLTGLAKKIGEGRCILPQHLSATPLSPIPMGLYEIIRTGLPSPSPLSHHQRACHDSPTNTPVAIAGNQIRRNIPQRYFSAGCLRVLSEQPARLINKFYRVMVGIIVFPERGCSEDVETKTGFPYAVGVQKIQHGTDRLGGFS